MPLSYTEIRDILLEKVKNKEKLETHEIKELADKSDDFNEITLNNLYCAILEGEEHKQPSPELIAQEIMKQIKHFNIKAGETTVGESIVPPIYKKYPYVTQETLSKALEHLYKKGYLDKNDNDNEILTRRGYDAL